MPNPKPFPPASKDYELLLTYTELVVFNMKDCDDHYEYTGTMNDVETCKTLLKEARLALDHHRIMEKEHADKVPRAIQKPPLDDVSGKRPRRSNGPYRRR